MIRHQNQRADWSGLKVGKSLLASTWFMGVVTHPCFHWLATGIYYPVYYHSLLTSFFCYLYWFLLFSFVILGGHTQQCSGMISVSLALESLLFCYIVFYCIFFFFLLLEGRQFYWKVKKREEYRDSIWEKWLSIELK